ncbi:WD40-repeat-containing domain protein [Histomonas meleagridis]|uniref:WD40-repeat-containing domain protein n=1 Tax=Histomonas meleagridis TaxID=135588 RepID=UPI00355ABBA0|nr:WD40-repeat-containing domain protein [Histomonas meleagridis]KAH0798010.1 WD40-repeat-containing domain protein [Histomonas meleagridis]
MFNHNRLMQKENEILNEENQKLLHLVKMAQERVKELSGSLQNSKVSILPPITVCNELVESNGQKKSEKYTSFFDAVGKVSLSSIPLTLCDGPLVAVGESNGSISLWDFNTLKCNQNMLSLYRFRFQESSDANIGPIKKASQPLTGHEGPVTSVKWVNDSSLSTVSLDSTLKIWDIETGENQSFYTSVPAVSHASIESSILVASCTKNLVSIDVRDPNPTIMEMNTPITAVASTSLGILLGTSTGSLLLFDPRTNKTYQSIQVSTAQLPISKISGTKNITVTSFDGIVRQIGNELPIYVQKEYARSPTNGSIIGSCCVSLASEEFVISGSTIGKAVIWKSSKYVQTLQHSGNIVYDCIPLNNYVGAFVTCDNSKQMTMYARSFDQFV